MKQPAVREPLRRRRAGSAVVVALALVLTQTGPGRAQDASEAADAARREAEAAQARLDAVLARRDQLQQALDRAVGNYEGRRGQLERLDTAEDQFADELDRLAQRTAQVEQARDRFVRSLYKRPASALYTWAMNAGDIGDAVHRGLMVGYVLDAGARSVEEARTLGDDLRDRTGQVEELREQATVALADLEQAQTELNAILVEMADLERSARQLVATTAARADELEDLAARGGGPLRCPVGSPNSFVDTWGAPRSGGRSHKGIDIFAPEGTELYAVASGTIDRADTLSLGGITLHLDTDTGDRYYYAHLSAYASGIRAGVRVVAGQVVGYVGRTGNARTTPPHLHWEHHPGGGGAVNPYPLTRQLCR